MTVAIIAGTNFDRVTNRHPHLTEFAHEIHIRRMQI